MGGNGRASSESLVLRALTLLSLPLVVWSRLFPRQQTRRRQVSQPGWMFFSVPPSLFHMYSSMITPLRSPTGFPAATRTRTFLHAAVACCSWQLETAVADISSCQERGHWDLGNEFLSIFSRTSWISFLGIHRRTS